MDLIIKIRPFLMQLKTNIVFLYFQIAKTDVKEVILTIIFTAASLCSFQLRGQQTDFLPKREFRGVWVATVSNIDWPSAKGLSPEIQKKEFVKLLDVLQSCNINAVIVQVRPKADALYHSATEPWSAYLSGRQGQDPGYDPLEFMVAQAHERGMELHAWMNPFRITTGEGLQSLSMRNAARRYPQWTVNFGGRYYFNPGLPQVREYLLGVVAEVVGKYDIDAVHLDDYFYPYPVRGASFPDKVQWECYGREKFPDIADWRRDNVNTLVRELSDTIKKIKSYVRFGVSPFGIYRNSSSHPSGSATNGISNYDDLYADVELWLREGWVDYVVPQLYWENGHSAADYAELLRWWSSNSGQAQLYIGHGIYNISPSGKKAVWRTTDEIARQIDMQRLNMRSIGSVFYSAKYFMSNVCGLTDRIRTGYYTAQALVPPVKRLGSTEPAPAQELRAYADGKNVSLRWQKPDVVHSDAVYSYARPRYYVVYRFASGNYKNLNDASAIVGKVWASGPAEFTDRNVPKGRWTYAVTSVSAAGVENENFSAATVDVL